MIMKQVLKYIVFGVSVTIFAIAITNSASAEYPTKPIKIIIPWGPGGTTDLSCRKLSLIAEKALGQPLVVTNKPGATGTNGTNEVVHSKPDGYTIACVTAAPIMIVPNIRNIKYDPIKDLRSIMNYSGSYHGVVVPHEAQWKSFEELIEFGKKKPGLATYATAGTYDGSHFSMIYVEDKSGAKFTHVPFIGGATARAAVMGRHVSFAVVAGWADHVKNGDLRLLAVVDGNRDPNFSYAPTLREGGYDWEYSSIMGFMAPTKTPDEVVSKLEKTFLEASATKEFQDFMKSINMPMRVLNAKEFGQLINSTVPFYGEMAKKLGIKQ
jgi:tripartite-type tricarboxylate transporter receptor subunit TctC